MSDEVKTTKVGPESADSVVDGESIETQDNLKEAGSNASDDVNKRLLNESKNWKLRAKKTESEMERLQAELEALRHDKLSAEGKKDELIQSLKRQNAELDSKLKQAVGNFAKSKAMDVITDEAVKLGCTSSRLVKKMVEDELDNLDYDESFNPDRDQVRTILEKIRAEEPILFSKKMSGVANHNNLQSNVKEKKPKSLKDMSDEEILKAIR